MPKKASTVDPNETDAMKLKRLGALRVNKIIAAIRALGNLSRLEPNPKQKEAVFNTLKKELEIAFSRWEGKQVQSDGFSMPT